MVKLLLPALVSSLVVSAMAMPVHEHSAGTNTPSNTHEKARAAHHGGKAKRPTFDLNRLSDGTQDIRSIEAGKKGQSTGKPADWLREGKITTARLLPGQVREAKATHRQAAEVGLPDSVYKDVVRKEFGKGLY